MKYHFFKIILNFLAVVLLIVLIATPIYFARSVSKVAGVKSESDFLVVSQIEKFPNLTLEQEGDIYRIYFNKQGSVQAYLGVLIVNNPTGINRKYTIYEISGDALPFFGEDLHTTPISIVIPSKASVGISLYSIGDVTENQSVQFKITAQGE